MMHRLLNFVLLLAVVAVAHSTVSAQQRKPSEHSDIASRIWVGGSINNNLRFGGGAFSFGLTPMGGYVVVPNVSIGRFLRMDYYYERTQIGQATFVRYASLDLGPGIFARADVFKQFFVQVEYEHAFLKRALYDNNMFPRVDNNNKVLKETIEQNYVYVGAGYSGGETVQYGISLHYNVLDDFFSLRFPWDYRITIKVPLNTRSR
jgi:hypothetical protein